MVPSWRQLTSHSAAGFSDGVGGVAQQVDEHLLQLVGIALHRDFAGRASPSTRNRGFEAHGAADAVATSSGCSCGRGSLPAARRRR